MYIIKAEIPLHRIEHLKWWQFFTYPSFKTDWVTRYVKLDDDGFIYRYVYTDEITDALRFEDDERIPSCLMHILDRARSWDVKVSKLEI